MRGVLIFFASRLAEGRSECNCACCTQQSKGDGAFTLNGTKQQYGCAPVFYGQRFLHDGFAECQRVFLKEGIFCDYFLSEEQEEDAAHTNLEAARSSQVDYSLFCLHACEPASDFLTSIPNGECVTSYPPDPATVMA